MALLAGSRREDRWASHRVTTLVLGERGLVVAGRKGPSGFGTWKRMTWVPEWHLVGDEQDTVGVLIWGLRMGVRIR